MLRIQLSFRLSRFLSLQNKHVRPTLFFMLLYNASKNIMRIYRPGFSYNTSYINSKESKYKMRTLQRGVMVTTLHKFIWQKAEELKFWVGSTHSFNMTEFYDGQRQPFRGVLVRSCSENIQQIYRRKPLPKCSFNKVASNFIKIAIQHGCTPGNFLHIFRTPFYKNTYGGLLLDGGNLRQ